MNLRGVVCSVLALFLFASVAFAQAAYQPKFAGDPARSESEARALGYMRVVLTAERTYHNRHGRYATTLQDLVGQQSFTKRMTTTTRDDYKVRFKGTGEGFSLWMDAVPEPGPTHRSFFADEHGTIHAEEDRHAGPESPVVKR